MSVFTEEILDRYKREIILKAKWTYDSIVEGLGVWNAIAEGKHDGKAEEVIRRFVSGITYAMSIVRILNVAGARNSSRAQIRVDAIKNKWPNLPDAPQGLKQIRDDLEHFEERLDTWAFTSSSHSIVDLNLGMSPEGLGSFFGVEEKELLRNVDLENNFLFWNHKVKLKEVLDWAQKLKEEIEK